MQYFSQRGHSAILLTFIKLPFVVKTFVLSFYEWLFYTGFTVTLKDKRMVTKTIVTFPCADPESFVGGCPTF